MFEVEWCLAEAQGQTHAELTGIVPGFVVLIVCISIGIADETGINYHQIQCVIQWPLWYLLISWWLCKKKCPGSNSPRAHPKLYFFLEDDFSLCERALPAMLLVRALDLPSWSAFEALLATLADVTFLAISEVFPSFSWGLVGLFQAPVIQLPGCWKRLKISDYLSLPIGTSRQKALPFFG